MDDLKDESPEKSKFANSLVAMYGSGSDTSEDDDSQQNTGQPSAQSLQNVVPKELETEGLKDSSEVLSDVVSTINETSEKSPLAASKADTDETAGSVSDNLTPSSTQVPTLEEDMNKIESDKKVTLTEGLETCVKTSAIPEEVKSTVTRISSEESVKEHVGEDTLVKTVGQHEVTPSKSGEVKLDEVLLEVDSVKETETLGAKAARLSDSERSDVGKSVQDIVAEIDDILSQGALPSKVREIQVSKSEEPSIETAVADINFEDEMVTDSTAAVSTEGEADESPAVSGTSFELMSVDKELCVGDHIEKMEQSEENATENKVECLNAEKGKDLGLVEEKIQELPSDTDKQNVGTVQDKDPQASEVAIVQSLQVSNEICTKEKITSVVDISTKEEVPKIFSTVAEIFPEESDKEDKQMAITNPEVSEESQMEVDDLANEKTLKSTNIVTEKDENVEPPAIVSEAEPSIEEIPKSPLPTTDGTLGDPKPCETANVKKESTPCKTEYTKVCNDTTELQETKPEPMNVPKEDILKSVSGDEGGQNAAYIEEALVTVEKENLKEAEATEEASDSSFATCEDLDKSDEIAKGEEELKFADATDELPSNEKTGSPESTPGRALVNEESKFEINESAMKGSEVLNESQSLKKEEGSDPVASAAELGSDPVVSAPEPVCDPVASAPEQFSDPVAASPERRPASVASAPKQGSDSPASAKEVDSDFVASVLEHSSDPVGLASEQICDPVSSVSEQVAGIIDSLPNQSSDLVASTTEQDSEHADSASCEVIPEVTANDSTEDARVEARPEGSRPAKETQMECEKENTEVVEKMEVDEVVPPEDVATPATEVVPKPDSVVEEAQASKKRDENIEPQVEDSKDGEVTKVDETKRSSLDEKLTSQQDVGRDDIKEDVVEVDVKEDVVKEDVRTEVTGTARGRKKETMRRLRQVRHPSAKAAEAAADAAFVAAVTPTRTNLKEAKIAYAIANVTETAEVIPKELTTQSRFRKSRSSSTEPQPAAEVQPTEQPNDKPVSIKLKIIKDAVEIVSSERPDSTVPPAEGKRQKRDLSDLPAAKEPRFMKNLEVQIPPTDVNIYETTMSPGGTSRKHKRLKEGSASPSVTLSPITLKIAKDKSSENLCCIVPEEVRTASPVDSEGREKITLKISKDDKLVRASVSPLVSPAEWSEEAKSEKAALRLAKEEAAALVRNREGVSSPRSDDGESRLERITLKLSVGEKNSWSIKSADSDSALSPSSTDSGSTKIKPKISVVRMEDLLEGDAPRASKRHAQTAGNESFVLQIAPGKRPLEEADELPSKVMRVEEVAKPASVVSDDVEILDDKPEVTEEPVEHKPPIEEIILEDSSSAPVEPTLPEKTHVQQTTPMDVDDDIVILSAKIVKKARGRPRKVRPLEGSGSGSAPTPAATTPAAGAPSPETKPQAEEPQDNRPKRVCKGRERPPPKPTKPRGRYAHMLKLRQAEEAAAAAALAAAADGVLPSSPAVTVTIVPPATSAAPTPASTPAVTIVKVPKESPVKTAKESLAKTKELFARSPKESPTKAVKESSVKAFKEHPAKTPRGTAPRAPHPKSKIIRPEAPQVFEEETRMSADIGTCPTSTSLQSESSGATASAQATPALQAAVQPEGRQGISFNSPLAAIDSTGILPRLVITPCTPVRPQTPALSTTGDESQSNSTTELTRASGNKKGRMEVVDPDAKAEFTVDMIAEYMWPVDKPGVRGEIFMIQEQISLYLGVKSFKRKYPNLFRRPVEHEERQYLLDRKLVSEKLCDLGLTAIVNHEVLDVMVVDFPEKYEEFRKFASERAQRQLTSKQKAVPTGRLEDSTSVSQRDAASFNSMLNRERREQRKCSFDLQAFSIQYPESRRKRMTPANLAKVGHYPVALVPGQYTDYYKKYTAAELRYFPLNTVLYGPLMPGEIRNLHLIGGSEGSQTDSSDSSSSDSESSNSGSSGSSDSDSSSGDSDDEMSSQVEKTESHDSIPDKDVSPCKVCQGDRQKNKLGVPEPMIVCAVCSSSGHPTCLDLTVDMVPHIRKYSWQCTDCKTCAQCKDPADEDKMLFCDMCDRGYHIYCVGLRRVPEGRWHCTECAICSSCGSKDPGGLPEQQKTEPAVPNNTPNKSDMPQWQHEFKKGDKGLRLYVRTLCVPCSRLWKKGRYCRLCWKCYGNKPEEEGLINCSACDRWMHSDCCRSAGSVIDDKTSNFLCELCQQRGVRSPTKNFKTPVR